MQLCVHRLEADSAHSSTSESKYFLSDEKVNNDCRNNLVTNIQNELHHYFADDAVNVSVDKIQTHMYWVSDTESAVQPGYVTRNCVYRSRKQLFHTSGINI